MSKIRMSGVVGELVDNPVGVDYRNVLCDCGGIVTVRDNILADSGYKEGDRIVISIEPCPDRLFYYPQKSKTNGNKIIGK